MGLGKTVQLITYLLNVHARPETTDRLLSFVLQVFLGTGKRKLNDLHLHLQFIRIMDLSREKDEDFTELLAQ